MFFGGSQQNEVLHCTSHGSIQILLSRVTNRCTSLLHFVLTLQAQSVTQLDNKRLLQVLGRGAFLLLDTWLEVKLPL